MELRPRDLAGAGSRGGGIQRRRRIQPERGGIGGEGGEIGGGRAGGVWGVGDWGRALRRGRGREFSMLTPVSDVHTNKGEARVEET